VALLVLASLFGGLSILVAANGSAPGDERALVELNELLGTGLDDLMVAVGRVSDTIPLVGLSLAVAAVLAYHRRFGDLASMTTLLVIAMAGNRLFKELVSRPRPDVRPNPESLSTYSFPSGHAANSLAVVLALLLVAGSDHRRRIVGVAGAAAVALVGFSRLAIGVHYPSDIAAGWLWSTTVFAAVVWQLRRLDQP
jgi:undecaprenyl-diphosphatase